MLQLTSYAIHLEKKVVSLENEKTKKSSKLNTKCKFSDKGFCKKRQDCLYPHPRLICQKFFETDKCEYSKTCPFRHPKKCKFGYKCFRRWSHCQYLHTDDEERHEAETNDDKEETVDEVDNDIDEDKSESNNIPAKEISTDDKFDREQDKDHEYPQESLEEIMAKARAFDISTESLDANGDDESIETIMAKAKAFAEEDDD